MLHLFENIKTIRILYGETQEKFGLRMGVTKGMQYSYEKNTAPDGIYLRKLSALTGLSIEELKHTKISESQIHVLNPDNKQMEFTLVRPTNAQGISELEARIKELENRIIGLEAEKVLLLEMNDKLSDKLIEAR
jgi:transcriptional regulator with XRE-family HTH domain